MSDAGTSQSFIACLSARLPVVTTPDSLKATMVRARARQLHAPLALSGVLSFLSSQSVEEGEPFEGDVAPAWSVSMTRASKCVCVGVCKRMFVRTWWRTNSSRVVKKGKALSSFTEPNVVNKDKLPVSGAVQGSCDGDEVNSQNHFRRCTKVFFLNEGGRKPTSDKLLDVALEAFVLNARLITSNATRTVSVFTPKRRNVPLLVSYEYEKERSDFGWRVPPYESRLTREHQ